MCHLGKVYLKSTLPEFCNAVGRKRFNIYHNCFSDGMNSGTETLRKEPEGSMGPLGFPIYLILPAALGSFFRLNL